MTKQQLHSALAPLDILTREELDATLHKNMDAAIRDSVRGLDLVRLAVYPVTATGTVVQLYAPNDQGPWGPEQGDVWALRRVIVKSSSLVDTAKYILFKGSTPSDLANSYSSRFLFDAIVGGATPGQNVNVGLYLPTLSATLQPGEQMYAQINGATAGNQYTIEGEAIRCPAEMKGKLV